MRTFAALVGTSLLAMSMVASVAEAKTEQGNKSNKSGGSKSGDSKTSGAGKSSGGSKSGSAKSGSAKSGGNSGGSKITKSTDKPGTKIIKPANTPKGPSVAKPAGPAGPAKVTSTGGAKTKLPGAIGALGAGAAAAAAWKADAAKGPQKDAKGEVSSAAMSKYVSTHAAAKHASIVTKGSTKHTGAKLLAQKIAHNGWGGYKTAKYAYCYGCQPVCPSCGTVVIIINAITKVIYYPSGYGPDNCDYDACDYVVVGKTESDCGCDDDQDA